MLIKDDLEKTAIGLKVFGSIIDRERVKNFTFHKTEPLYSVMRQFNFFALLLFA